ncbi:NAC domain-containing protein 2-like [Camellia sinensis]|uniref:NAC domain-containing protein 2-like n=1 Tax=Camellia sinensis TaxID=4442 RepID=UPI001036220F|nr:NAC domain-containing protein 2-like [Camellia sinensis]
MAASGYWKAAGTDKPILSSCGARIFGVKKALVFYRGRPPRGIKTDRNMQEYRLPEATRLTSKQKRCMRTRFSSISFEASKNSTTVCEGYSDTNYSQYSVPPFDNSINGQKRKQPTEGTQYENIIQPKKKVTDRDDQWSDDRTESNNYVVQTSLKVTTSTPTSGIL